MAELTNQVIKQWSQIPAPATPGQFDPDVKSSYLKTAIKSEILTPTHTVSIAPISFKVEVDPLVYLAPDSAISVAAHRLSTMGLFQSVDIKATGKLAFKGDKEVAFKSKSNVEYSAKDDKNDDNYHKWPQRFVGLAITTSVLVAIAGEILASKKLKDEQKYLWLAHMGLSRLISMIFSLAQKEKIKIELATSVKDAADREKADAAAAAADAAAAAKIAADQAQADAIAAAVNPVGAAAAAAAAAATAAAAAAAAAQNTADQNNDALTRSIERLNAVVNQNQSEIDNRLRIGAGYLVALNAIVQRHHLDISQLRSSGTVSASGEKSTQ